MKDSMRCASIQMLETYLQLATQRDEDPSIF